MAETLRVLFCLFSCREGIEEIERKIVYRWACQSHDYNFPLRGLSHSQSLPLSAKIPPMADLRIGTSAFTASGWEHSFYPKGMKPADYLSHYATKFDTVEIDSTFYRTPTLSTVKGWDAKTPPGFTLQVPR
jgi:Protein of unknown function DUF72